MITPNIRHCSLTANELEEHFKTAGIKLPGVNLSHHAQKIFHNAHLIEAWDNHHCLIGIVACYMNDMQSRKAFITHVYVNTSHRGMGIANLLLEQCKITAKNMGFISIELEVAKNNLAALNLYYKHGFSISNEAKSSLHMILKLI